MSHLPSSAAAVAQPLVGRSLRRPNLNFADQNAQIWHRTRFSTTLGVVGAVVLFAACVGISDGGGLGSQVLGAGLVTLGFAIYWFRPMVAVLDGHLVARNPIFWRWANLAQVESTDRELNLSNSYTIQFRVYRSENSNGEYAELPATLLGKPFIALPFLKYQSDEITAEVLRLASLAREQATGS